MSAGEILKTILGSFFGTVFVSIIIGVFTALLCSYIFKKCRFLIENEVTQVAFTYIFGILSYMMAEFFGMSGVITVLISGVVLAHYNFYNLTVGGMHATTYLASHQESPSSRSLS
jgi:NhaP-type Na+/H+ or K+/H+ antiporter